VSGRLLTTLNGHRGCVVNVAFSQDESAILTGTHDGEVRLWDRESGRLRAVLEH